MAALTEIRVADGRLFNPDIFTIPLRGGIAVLNRMIYRTHSIEDISVASRAEVKEHPLRQALIDFSLVAGTFIGAIIQRNSF